MKRLVLLLLLLLAACGPSEEERAAAFAKDCEAADFTPKQCGLLFAMKEKAASDADSAASLAAFGVGMASVKR